MRSWSLSPKTAPDVMASECRKVERWGVDDALRVAGGAACVAHGRRRVLVDRGPRVARLLGGEQGVVAERVKPERREVAGADHDVVLDGGEIARHASEHGHEGLVDQDDLVPAVVDHVRELLGEEAGR